MSRVYGFKGTFEYLSNFWPSPMEIKGIHYPTVEHAFQSAKTFDVADREWIASLPTPALAKRAGNKNGLNGRVIVKRDDWENVKDTVMLYCVRRNFNDHPELRTQLLLTGGDQLIEANWWNDRCWGVDQTTGKGENRLGHILMRVRSEIKLQST